jgi:hypothetical protein
MLGCPVGLGCEQPIASGAKHFKNALTQDWGRRLTLIAPDVLSLWMIWLLRKMASTFSPDAKPTWRLSIYRSV